MPSFEFLHPDKSPQNARKPKRKKAKNLQKEQPTRTLHPHNKIPPKFRKYHDCTLQVSHVHRCQVSTQQSTPKFRNAPKSKVSDYLKRPSKFPPTQQSTPKFHNAPKSKVSDYLKQPSKFPPTQQSTPKFPYTHEVREFLTIQRPNAPDQTPTPPKHFGGSDSLQKPHLSRENFTPWGLDRPPPAPPRTGGNPSVCVPKNA